jgi:FMN hydrolase / 5-amino-6-(5-phospho-D-ribitylamino)uracil phosphatase
MSDISQIKVISVDLFRTLVPLPQSHEFIRHWYLDGKYPEDLAERIEQRSEEILSRRWDAAGIDDTRFISVQTILEETLSELFAEIPLNLEVKQVADRIMSQHRPHPLFEDAKPFLQAAGKKFPVCLSSDCDLPMLNGIDQVYAFDKVFASEDLGLYKLNPRFFVRICEHYGFQPGQILHIGDSKSDIIAPQQIGIMTCWLNRKNKKWEGAVKPDHEVKSLMEILQVLGL